MGYALLALNHGLWWLPGAPKNGTTIAIGPFVVSPFITLGPRGPIELPKALGCLAYWLQYPGEPRCVSFLANEREYRFTAATDPESTPNTLTFPDTPWGDVTFRPVDYTLDADLFHEPVLPSDNIADAAADVLVPQATLLDIMDKANPSPVGLWGPDFMPVPLHEPADNTPYNTRFR